MPVVELLTSHQDVGQLHSEIAALLVEIGAVWQCPQFQVVLQAGGDLGVLIDADRVGGGVLDRGTDRDRDGQGQTDVGFGGTPGIGAAGAELFLRPQIHIGPCQQVTVGLDGDAVDISGLSCGVSQCLTQQKHTVATIGDCSQDIGYSGCAQTRPELDVIALDLSTVQGDGLGWFVDGCPKSRSCAKQA